MPTSTSHEGWLQVCVSRCQVVAGQVSHDHTHTMLSEIQGIVAAVPDTITVPDQLVVRGLIGQALGRILSAANTAQNSTVVRAFLAFSACGFASGHWRREVIRLIDCCNGVLEASVGQPRGHRDCHPHVEHAQRIIEDRFREPALNLRAVATALDMSTSHLSRLFAANTGQGFMTHLHVRRVAAARRMLIESQRSVKEVAAAVGYRSVTQLDRYFKRVFALTPNAVRAGAHAMSQSPTSSCQQLYTLRKN